MNAKILLFVSVTILLVCQQAYSQEKDSRRSFLQISVPQHQLEGGDFDGSRLYTDDSTYHMPTVDAGQGIGIAWGVSDRVRIFNRSIKIEGQASVNYSQHQGEFVFSGANPADSESSLFFVDALFRTYLFNTGPLETYSNSGFGIVRLDVKNAKTNADGAFDTHLNGLSLFLGLGTQLSITKRTYVGMEINYRYANFLTVDTLSFKDDLEATDLNLAVFVRFSPRFLAQP